MAISTQSRTQGLSFEASRLLRNTYLLLTLTLATSAVTAGMAMLNNASPVNFFVMLLVFLGMPFVIHKFRDSIWSLPLTFLFTGFMGYVLGPILGLYLTLANGPQIVMTAFATTATMFLGLSAYALVSRQDFSFMRGFLMVGLIVLLLAIVANFFFMIPAVSLAISAAAVLLMSGMILFDTSRMVHGGEDNYVVMTVSLFANIYVLFLHLLNLITAFTGHE